MTIFIRLGGGRQVYAEVARWTRPDSRDPWFEVRVEAGEVVLWFGRLMVIYTPARHRVSGHERAGPAPGPASGGWGA